MKNRGKVFINIGLLLMVAALFLVAYNFYEAQRAQKTSMEAARRLEEMFPQTQLAENEIPDYILNPNMEMPTQNIDGQDYIGILTIPAIGVELPVIREWSYPKLKIAPCCYKGSAYTNDFIIAAHNYGGHFGNLKNLHLGDTVTFKDTDENVFTYEVVELDSLSLTAVEEMESGIWDLTLFTCTRGNQSRITVRCELVEK